ncbi:hypothetical protein [Streptomyces sp. CA2R101]|uniref:hypothetical protein n=1 Tax=Streptomyces sp. CA2R101 TaxID=3120152 RepID=UPI003FA6AFE9
MQRTERGGQGGHPDETDGTEPAGHHDEEHEAGHQEGHEGADDAVERTDDAESNGGTVCAAADEGAKADTGEGEGEGHDRGRGLLLIRFLSSASGCRPTPRGKAVWFTLPELRRSRRR